MDAQQQFLFDAIYQEIIEKGKSDAIASDFARQGVTIFNRCIPNNKPYKIIRKMVKEATKCKKK